MVGAAPKNRKAIDHYQWGREALRFSGMQRDEFEQLADKLGLGAAGEVLLLAVARKCGDKREEWSKARALGIPWQQKRWSWLSKLQSSYNDAVKLASLVRVDEDACSEVGSIFGGAEGSMVGGAMGSTDGHSMF